MDLENISDGEKLTGDLKIKNNVSKEKNPLTVIVPTYNRCSYLEKALPMLKAQTLQNIKFIIVDDGSSDGSADYVKNQIKGDARFKFIKLWRNHGPYTARNKALKYVKSKYVGFFDVDDEIPVDYFEKLYLKAKQSKADIIYTNYNKRTHRLGSIKQEADKYQELRNGAIWDKLYLTSLLKDNDIEFIENRFTADNLFNIRAFHAAKKIVLTNEPNYSYKLQDDSIGKDKKLLSKRKKDILAVVEEIVNFVNENKFDPQSRLAIRGFIKRSYDCYLDDVDFRYKLLCLLQRIDAKMNLPEVVRKFTTKEYNAVMKSELFDSKYYRLHNPRRWFNHRDLLRHYLNNGWLNGKNPSAKFDGDKYLALNPDVAKAGFNPLVHYVMYGMKEGRPIYPVEGVFSKKQRVVDILSRIKKEYNLVEKSGYFSSFYYRLHNPSLWFTRRNLLEHYLIFGWLEGKNPSAAFNGNKYLVVYPKVAEAMMNPLVHYVEYGISEGRECFEVNNTMRRIRCALEYPIRVKEEYDRLNAEIKALENM